MKKNKRLTHKARLALQTMTYAEWKASGGWKRVNAPSLKSAPVNRKTAKRSTPVMSGGTFGNPAATERRI